MKDLIMKWEQRSKGKRNIFVYSLGTGISAFGSSIYVFAMSLYILKTYDSSGSYAINLVMGSIPLIIFSPIAGILCDKFSKKKIIIVMDVMNGIIFLSLYLLKMKGILGLHLIYVTTLISSVFMVIFFVATEALKPELVEERNLVNINSIGRIINSTSMIMGPVLGGVVYSFMEIEIFMLINGVSFLTSAALEMILEVRNKNMRKENNKVSYKQVFNYIVKNPEYLVIIKTAMVLNFAMGASLQVALPVLLMKVLEVSSKSYGIIQGFFSLGIIFGAMVIMKYKERLNIESKIITICSLIGIVIMFLTIPLPKVGDVGYIMFYGVVLIIIGILVSMYDISLMCKLQREKEERYRSKIMAVMLPLFKVFLLLGLLIGGYLVENISVIWTFFVGGILVTLGGYFSKK